jgi:retron-type reverse transcriptase
MMSASWGKCLDFIHGGLQGFMREVDQELEKRGLEFCRFADDCNIFVKSQKAANRVMEKVSQFIEKKLKLKVNRDTTKYPFIRYFLSHSGYQPVVMDSIEKLR